MAHTSTTATDLEARLASRTLELVNLGSESGAERDIVDHVVAVLAGGGVPARDAGDTCVVAGTTARTDRPLVLLAGHLDTVPAQHNWPGRMLAEHVAGVGASDMKSGVAVMLELALGRAAEPQGRYPIDLGFMLFGREELSADRSALAPLLEREDALREADLAIVLEPTANVVQAGCLGNLDATWTFHGRAGHSARPWLADNAIDHAIAGIRALHAFEPLRVAIDGLGFTQVASVTALHAGIARNVIPAMCTANVNFRYSPSMSATEAARNLREICEQHGELDVVSNSQGALPPHENPLMSRLVDCSGAPAQPKQAWTPVAEFANAGVDAVNFGPGDPAFAHRADERVSIAALARAHDMLQSFLCA
ncbi:MAG TPA: succinyl-diaminopimelate desuccinylase [Solirubrobacteraceae bacterium]|jgi:succinyl-diaminopimelate desuccinylase|nr:succinyl-diaminopimelate desuccinylase [Solirubrobacteraceae bacterium]